jgi:hypothetical protein
MLPTNGFEYIVAIHFVFLWFTESNYQLMQQVIFFITSGQLEQIENLIKASC